MPMDRLLYYLPKFLSVRQQKFHRSESSREQKFLEQSLLRTESSTGAKVPWSKSSCTFHSPAATVPQNESATGAKVLSVDFSLPGAKVQGNEKSRYHSLNLVTDSYTKFELTMAYHQLVCAGLQFDAAMGLE